MIIENQEQCEATKEWIARFGDDLRRLDACPPTDLAPRMVQAIRGGLESMIARLQRQVTAYETGIPEPPFQPTPEYLERVAQVRKEFEDRFGRWECEEAAREIP